MLMNRLFACSADMLLAAPAVAQEVNPAPAPSATTGQSAQPATQDTSGPASAAPQQESAPQAAQPSAIASAAAAAPQCELHVWPAERFQSVSSGWGSSFGLLGALADSAAHAKGDKSRR